MQPAVRAGRASENSHLAAPALGIESSLHWVRDVTYDGDRSTTHIGNGAQFMASLRNTAINRHRLDGATNIAEACRATALTVNRRLDLLSPRNPSSTHKPANQLRRNPGVQRLPRRHDHIVREAGTRSHCDTPRHWARSSSVTSTTTSSIFFFPSTRCLTYLAIAGYTSSRIDSTRTSPNPAAASRRRYSSRS